MDVYEKLGVRKVINGSGTLTSLGGNTLDPEVTQAMREAALSFVFMDELQRKAGEVIAGITGAESAYVVSGAAAGLMMSVVACISRGDLEVASMLPENEGLRCESWSRRRTGASTPRSSRLREAGQSMWEVPKERPRKSCKRR